MAAPPTYSVRIEGLGASTGQGAVRSLHVLYEGCNPVARSRSARQVLGALRYALGVTRAKVEATDLLAVPAQVITRGGAAVLLPPRTSNVPSPVDRQLIADGFRRLVTQEALVEGATGRLLVPEPLPLDDQAAGSALGEAWDASSPRTEPGPGRYEVVGWIFDRSTHQPVDSRAAALARALQLMERREQHISAGTLTVLAGLIRAINVVAVEGPASSEVVQVACEMLRPNVDRPSARHPAK